MNSKDYRNIREARKILNKGIRDKMGGLMSSGQHDASPKTKEIRAGIKVARKELANAIDKAMNNTRLEEFQQGLDEMKQLTILFNNLTANEASASEARYNTNRAEQKDRANENMRDKKASEARYRDFQR